MSTFTLHTFAERPDRAEEADELCPLAWPEFMLHDPVANSNWGYLMDEFAEYQLFLCNQDDHIVAVGNAIPVTWDGQTDTLPEAGWDAVFEQGVSNLIRGIAPTALSALQAVVVSSYQGQGLSSQVIQGMRTLARRGGLPVLIAPVRPNQKHRYPLTPMERYLTWTQPDGQLFDPWLRTHARLGARLARVAPQSMRIPGALAEWEQWTGMRFPESGDYIVPGALNPITIDAATGNGLYIEPNVWMVHLLS